MLLTLAAVFLVVGVIAAYSGPTPSPTPLVLYQNNSTQCRHTRVLGASYGLNDVTRKVANLYNKGERNITASADVLGVEDNDQLNQQLTVVSDLCGNIGVAISDDQITLY